MHNNRLATPHAGWLLGILIALYLLLTTAYAIATPVFEGFDGQAHYAAATFYRSERQFPELTPETVAYSYELIPHPPVYYLLAGAAALGWPVEEPLQLAQESVNLYFDKSLSYRQSVILPEVAFETLAPAWIARFVSMVGGLLALLCTWWLARVLFPRQVWLAMAAVAVAIFNPQFLYISVSITNDGWAAGSAALVLATAAHATLIARSPRAWLWVGLAIGMASLTKYSTLLVAAPVGLLWLSYWRRSGWRPAAIGALWAGGGFLMLAGWWFVRNFLLYGEIVPFDRMAEALPTMRRPVPYDLQTTLTYIPWLVASFWGVFVAVIAPGWYLDLTRWFMMLGFAGTLPTLRFLRNRSEAGLPVVYLVLMPWLLIVGLSVLYWTSTVDYGEQGRLAHIGASAFGVTMAVGWSGWLPVRWRSLTQGVVTGFMLALAVTGFIVLRNAFVLPAALSAPVDLQRPIDAHFEGGMRVVGVEFPNGAAIEPGELTPLTIYFTTDAPIQDDYTLFLHLADENDGLLYQFDGVAVKGGHPTRQWAPGQVFADEYALTIPETSAAGLATLSAGFYPVSDVASRQEAYDRNGQALGDRLVLAQVRTVEPEPSSAADSVRPVATWVNGIDLRNAAIEYDATGAPQGAILVWGTTETLNENYTVFIQVLDNENRILAQVDRQPQHGRAPTSTWRAGDKFRDVIMWEGDTRTWSHIIIGLYDAQGARLPVSDPNLLPDAVQLATSGISLTDCHRFGFAQVTVQCKLIRL
ncbi:MAG: glycosyltransferase family 39 protein [Caldilinea sp.]